MTIKELLSYLDSFSDIEKERELIIYIDSDDVSKWVHIDNSRDHRVMVKTNCKTLEHAVCYFLYRTDENDIKEREYYEQMKRELDI